MRAPAQLLSVPTIIRMPLLGGILMFLALVPSIGTAARSNLLWENREHPEPFGAAFAIGAQGNIVVATGDVCTTPEFFACDWFVRAHDTWTGDTLWEDRLGTANAFDRSQDVTVDAGRVFASGWIFTPAQGFDFVVRAYDLNSGAFLWDRRVDRGGVNEFAEGVVAHGGRVFAVGRVLGATGSSDFALLAFDARTGAALWESVTDPSGLQRVDVAFAVRARGDAVFVAGTIFRGTRRSLLVRAHDARTGVILWEDKVDDVTNEWQRNRALAVDGNLLFVGGMSLNTPNISDFMVRAYDVQTGALAWVDQVDQQAFESATALSVGESRLFAVGWDCDDNGFNCHVVVRSYNARTGALLWQDRFNEPGGDVAATINTAVLEAHGGQVFVGGGVLNTSGRLEWTLRAYDAQTGTLGWEDRVDEGGSWSQPYALRAHGDRLYVAGFITKSDETSDFTVRAYKTH